MAQNNQHVSKFSPDGKLFALINEYGILKIWDTETNELKQEYTPNLHLAGTCKCLTWLVVSQHQIKKQKKSRRSFSSDHSSDQLYLALGTNKGGVALYSYSLAEVDRYLKGGHSGAVNCITYDSSNLLFTCGEDCQIIVWNIYEEKRLASWTTGNEKPYSLVYLPETKNILVGARQIKLFSTESQDVIQTFTGHTSEVILLSEFVYNDTEYALSASKMERIICLWTLNSKRKNRTASCTFLMEDLAHCLTSKVDAEGNLKAAAVTRSGVIHLYIISLDSIKSEKPIKPKVTIEIASDSSSVIEPIPAVTASLQFGSAKKEILFGYGDRHFLCFEQTSPNFAEKLQVLIRTDPKKLHLKSSKKQSENALKTVTPIVNDNDVEYMTSSMISKKKMKTIQVPMETRLQNLHLSNGEAPQAQSKVQLLMQALHSKDSSLLRTVLNTSSTKVIQLTVQKLPVQYVASLINELTLLLQKKRSNVQVAANWLRVVVRTHSAQLMGLGTNDLLNKFGPCMGTIEYRTNCLHQISKVSGRLNMLISQIKRNTEEDNLTSENLLVYEDEESSESELGEQMDQRSISDDDWEEEPSDEEVDVKSS